MNDLHKGDIVYYARIMPTLGIFEVEELKLRTVEEDYFVGLNKHDKRAFLFFMNSIGDKIFLNRKDALNKVKDAQKLSALSYEEMMEISSEGAKVLHNRCVEIGEKFDVPIITESTFNDKPGTLISHKLETSGVKSIVKKEKV